MRRAEKDFIKIKYSTFTAVIKKNNPFTKEFLDLIKEKSEGLPNLQNKQIIIGTDGTRVLTRKIYGRKSIISHGLCSSGFAEQWVDDFYQAMLWELKKTYYFRITKNPLFLVILERIAYVMAKLKYADVNPAVFETEHYAVTYNTYMKTLFNCLDQIMKYTEVKTTLSKKKIDETRTLKLKGMTDEELKARARQLTGGGPGRITDNLGRVGEAKE